MSTQRPPLARDDTTSEYDDLQLSHPSRVWMSVCYAAMVVLAVLVFLFIREIGESLVGPRGVALPPDPSAGPSTLAQALLALGAIVITALAAGAVCGRVGQPPVMGEVIGGIVLGPSLLGRLAPGVSAQLLPAEVMPFLGIYAQLGVILYLFLVGLELDLGIIRKSGHATLAISHASIIAPFLLGSALALGLYPGLAGSGVPFTVFALFIGVSLSVTAFPVLARILTDHKMNRSRMGTIALTCAAVDDVTAWCLLALVVGVAQSRAFAAVRTVLLTAIFVAVVLSIVAPLIRALLRLDAARELTRRSVALAFIGMLTSAMTTEYIGIHGFFGAFLFGAVIPHDSRVATELSRRLGDFIAILFLPAFFAFTGLRTQIGLIDSFASWTLCGVVIFVACAGKFGGTLIAAHLAGLGWSDSTALGVLMNTRGLVELIVLNIGLDLRLISPTLFTMLVIMALVTTFMATPILRVVIRKHPWRERVTAGVGARELIPIGSAGCPHYLLPRAAPAPAADAQGATLPIKPGSG